MTLAWLADAACRGWPTDMWFPTRGEHHLAEPAKAVCRECTVVRQCLAYAMETPLTSGVWGGLTEAERDALRRDRPARCRHCAVSFHPRSRHQLFCCDDCRGAAKYAARKAREAGAA